MTTAITIRDMKLGEGKPKICVPLTGKTVDEVLDEIRAVRESAADLVEWRVDHFAAVEDLAGVRQALPTFRAALGELPLLFTFRTHKEGGVKEMSTEAYLALNLAVIETGEIDLVDVELFTGDAEVKKVVAAAHAKQIAVVVSSHDFQKTPPRAEIVARLKKMRALGADVPKVAVMPETFADVLTLLAATDEYVSGGADCPVITMSMKRLGGISRVAGEFAGSSLTFGTVRRASAPGQLTVADLATMLEIFHKS